MDCFCLYLHQHTQSYISMDFVQKCNETEDHGTVCGVYLTLIWSFHIYTMPLNVLRFHKTHWGHNKITAVEQMFSNFLKVILSMLIQIYLSVPIAINQALGEVIIWHQTWNMTPSCDICVTMPQWIHGRTVLAVLPWFWTCAFNLVKVSIHR